MAPSRKSAPVADDDFEEKIVDIDVGEEMRTSFLEYAYSVIYSRALPDARDGLKPVQRRILFTMAEMNLRPDRGHVKSARVVGEVMGRLHPHGDTAIYDALVRQAQHWSMRLPFVDGQGNFGSPDDPPAAMRYTECRMAPAALAMTTSIDEETVDFRANYDGRETEPVVLPAAVPNLVVNGTTGIAVGMATNIAPHNLVEVVNALRHMIAHPDATLDDLMRFVPGPDLPTGGKIVGLEGIRDAYATGRGSFRMRATARVEQMGRRRGIVVTELPYSVGPEKVIARIKTLVQAKKLQGIADVLDLTDGDKGLHLVIEVKNGFHAEAMLEQLYKVTPMEDSFGVNAVALVDGQPRTLGLVEMLQVFLDHRYDVVRRRTEHRRRRAADRLHLVDGLLVALLDIDEVIQVVRGSDDTATARERLMEVFDLSLAQADYILELQLRRLTRFSRIELEKEKTELEETLARLDEILGDEQVLRRVVSDELGEAAAEHGTPRRTVLLESAGQAVSATQPLEVPDDPCLVLLSATGLIARTGDRSPLGTGGGRASHDVVTSVVRSTARGEVGVLTSRGRLVRLDVINLPALPPTAGAPHLSGGSPLVEQLDLARGERVLGLTDFDPESPGLALGTRRGVVKRVRPEHLAAKDAWEVVTLADGDEVVGVRALATGDEELVFITSDAQLLHFPASAVRPQGRSGGGMAGVKLGAGAHVVFFGAFEVGGADGADAAVVTVAGGDAGALPGTGSGSIKVTPFTEYPGKGRATGGVRCHRLRGGEDGLVLAWAGPGPAMATAGSGSAVDLPAPDGRRDGSGVPTAQAVLAVASPAASAAGPLITPLAD